MADLDLSTGTGTEQWRGSHKSPDFWLYNKADFSVNNADASAKVSLIVIPAKHVVQYVEHIVLTAEGGTSTGTVGDGDDADGWIKTANNNATAGTLLASDQRPTLSDGSPNTFLKFTNELVPAKYYATGGVISMTLSANAVDTAVILVRAWVSDLSELA